MKRSHWIAAIALSAGMSGWLPPQLTPMAIGGDCCGNVGCQCGCASSSHGLLDTLDDYAARLAHNRQQRPSLLSSLGWTVGRPSAGCHCGRCRQGGHAAGPSCGSEPSCGLEPTCGTEATCGVEPSCGAEPNCGCVAEHRVQPHWEHQPSLPKVPPLPQPGHAPEQIPSPTQQDATIDPFRDDSAMQWRPQRVPVRAASTHVPASSRSSSSQSPRRLTFDPLARDASGQGRTTQPMPNAVAGSVGSSRRTHAEVRSLSDRDDASSLRSADVVTAAATEPSSSLRPRATQPSSRAKRLPAQVESLPNPLRGQ
ncbi:MAG: hypothetical protein ACTHOU_13875 [Aureliella sp.]